jgi:5'-3' exoribonuclease 1
MGVPKFFRWMSERYPAISQLIADNRIPEFDALYLDMNGIIHNCTHTNNDSPTFRLTEDKMFIAIFNYIEHLFSKIKPQKLFFMAIDGVAPRAKMNQQRARRFRTALDAEVARDKAIKEGVEMPKEDAFDSNCITPGTEFMARLTKQLKYFVAKKVSEDADWQGVEIVLSGHEVPGEGEHKIMEYIRQAKAQPEYDPNRRHCLYGLDADLIMLGLLSHDPHFCLLREEVTFGRQASSKPKELEHQNFYLMHLCIVREYLELEFQELKNSDVLGFEFDMERVLDDFILMAFFVGNDFLPNLPHLHINEGALALMFATYKVALPKAGGYINEGGSINMERLALLLDELSHAEYRFFEAENSDASWFKGKRLEKEDVMERTKRKGQLVISSEQRDIFKGVKTYVSSRPASGASTPHNLPTTLPARDRKFVEELADSLNLQWKTVEDGEGNRHMQLNFPVTAGQPGDDEDTPDEDDEEAQLALLRVLKRYENAKIVDVDADEAQARMEQKYEEKFQAWKDKYYKDKYGWGLDNEEEMRTLTENYVQGLQWVLYYYYRGVASWPWYYKYHYSPMISDVKRGLKADLNFKLGQPFRPFQQLMGVLPDRSKKIVPTTYWPLMTDPSSPIIDFYPRDFELDMNGKKQDWEAIVKIPFIEEKRLLDAMATKDSGLSEDEVHRNSFGVSIKFGWSKDMDYVYPSSLPGYFPDIEHCHCVENIFDLPTMDGLEYHVGLMPGALLGAQALASFPSLKTLPFTARLDFHSVNVFQQDSKNESMVVDLTDAASRAGLDVAKSKLGKPVFVGYPFLVEAKVVKVADELFDYVLATDGVNRIDQFPHDPRQIGDWKKKADSIENRYSKKLGTTIDRVEVIVTVEMLRGLKKLDDGSTIKEYGEMKGTETEYAAQALVDEVFSPDQRFLEKAAVPIEEEFPLGSKAFFLGEAAYGRPLEVTNYDHGKLNVWVAFLAKKEPEFGRQAIMHSESVVQYMPSFAVAKQLGINPLALSKITSSLSVESSGLRLNLGLNLKFERKNLKVLGYSRKGNTGWEYSRKAVELIVQYMTKFPEFIAGISMNPKGDIYTDTDFYPQDTAKAKMKEIGQWLKSVESKSFEKVPLEADQLDSDTVAKIEELADQNLAAIQSTPKMVKGVPRNALLNPTDAEHHIGTQRFSLGDRVVYVLNTGRVPIASRGTVIGMTRTSRETLLDIVFDTGFMSGTSLGERCRPFHGSTVPSNSVLNITDRQRMVITNASRQQNPAPISQPLAVSGGRGYGIAGQGQLHPARAPGPLSGSYRGAISGQPNGNAMQHGQLPIRTGPSPGGRAGYANTNGQSGPSPGRGGGRGGSAFANVAAQPNGQAENASPAARGGRGRGGAAQAGTRPQCTACGRPGHTEAQCWHAHPELKQQQQGSGSNRQGFTVVDNGNPHEGVHHNPNFRPKSYNNVPPPASLDANAGRGRGRGGGRGGRGRGRGGAAPPAAS